ncbi:hypothetical protein C8Q74DRAFT_758453 [Fomes fomentarius]|nr:hypothetical protein C8Q74DRAFT_758453 [Fomes fomentarius]
MAPRLCEVPVRYMLDNIVGGKTPTDEVRQKFRFWRVKRIKQESGLYWRASDSVRSALEAADYGDLHYVNIASHNKTVRGNDKTDTVNDGGIYRKDNFLLPRGVTTLDKLEEDRKCSNLKMPPENERKLGRWSWDHVVVPVEVNYNPRTAPFYFRERNSRVVNGADEGKDTEPGEYAEDEDPNMDADVPYNDLPKASAASGNRFPYIRDTAEGTEGLAQVTDYVTNVFIHQHRTFCYFIYILRNMCRLLYFDRSGAFVSTPFDWTTKETPYLHDFVWKIARIKVKAELGYDPSASFASPAEHQKFVSMCLDPSVPPEVRQYVKDASDNLAPLYKVRIKTTEVTPGERFSDKPDDDAATVEARSSTDASYGQTHVYEFIIGRPLFRAESLLGRCTRGFVALRLNPPQDAQPLCFLKDCWRAYMPGQTRPEHLVHQRLHEYKVRYIATLIGGGDVEGPGVQKTMVQEYLHGEDGRKYVPRVHYRMATEEIGLPLQEFRNFRELTLVMADVVKAHFLAWDDAKVLHRDISAGNIMINPTTRRGFLIDWELSRLECELEVGPVKPDCAGTWISRSALSLKYPRKPYRPWDDIESFVHVYRHLVLRYHPTNTLDFDLDAKLTYERFSIVNGIMVGGT